MAFHFSLETLLRYRRSQKEQEQRVLRAIHSNLAALRNQLEQLRSDCAAGRVELNDRLGKGGTGGLLREHQINEELFRHSEQALLMQIERFEHARLLQTQRFQESWRKCQTIESLRERQFGEWRQEQARREQKHLDELVITRFRTRSRDGHRS
jgi:flagellar export protein FliJ